MSVCTECNSIEGKTHENEDGIEICDQCGAEESIKHYDENDDLSEVEGYYER